MKELFYDRIASPIGEILVVVDGSYLCSLDFTDCEQRMMALLRRRYASLQLTHMADPYGYSSRIQAYFAGDYSSLDEIPVSTGGTTFQQQVWQALRTIPVGTITTYGTIAAQIGKPIAYRAVGATNALNPVGIVVPCHRVIGANASLTGYAGGLERKRWLLQHEGVLLQNKLMVQ
ncbi:methylated-DNA--[protein]-cysteine S-methyltransferase [Ktedonosporobacter rubrisoli]|uniref:Methylated-DNA--protein-cysteine methyltransferase n=1 Tax=Ktedonosporobacter rubrisoli TaxID=2509675 RepID=A0A4P6JQH2_KTERU|nr:methylated-DNA--[protein]-cysteine S-methyltransferase [Ktedonosporobacter rubrisoli]QBD77534.1 methylated-DNA--[protein]-cysteine S-methyltransferase [Ktedonosporobacter rubrisoli]